jgi:hypothetical protein
LLSSNAKRKTTLVLVVKAACSILICLQVEDARLEEAVKAHKVGHDTLDDQFGGIVDYSFASADLKTETHAVALHQKFDCVACGHWAATNQVDYLFVVVH